MSTDQPLPATTIAAPTGTRFIRYSSFC